MLLQREADSLLVRLRGEWGGKCLQRQPHLHCITASQLWRRATELFNCFSALTNRSSVFSHLLYTEPIKARRRMAKNSVRRPVLINEIETGKRDVHSKHAFSEKQHLWVVWLQLALYLYCCMFITGWFMSSFPASNGSKLGGSGPVLRDQQAWQQCRGTELFT